MFEDMTYERILHNVLSRVDDNLDKRQGSVIFDAIAPACAELAQAYVNMENVLDNSFADTACREYLVLRAKERGLEPYEATKAVARGVFDTEIPIGSRFSINTLCFEVKEKLSDYEYSMECESEGTVGNQYFGTLIPVGYINNLGSANLTEILIPGREEEDTESFRQRYFQNINNEAFGGNKADYINWVKSISGVGQAKVSRATAQDGNVNVYVLGANNKKPSTVLLNEIKQKLDPSDKSGYGAGIAPIGHCVNVSSADDYTVNVTINASYEDNADMDYIDTAFKTIIENYFDELNSQWESFEDGIEIYSAFILVKLIDVKGVENIDSVKIQNKSHILLPSNAILKLGNVKS